MSNSSSYKRHIFFLRSFKVEISHMGRIEKCTLHYFEQYDLGDAKELRFEN